MNMVMSPSALPFFSIVKMIIPAYIIYFVDIKGISIEKDIQVYHSHLRAAKKEAQILIK
jgi:hypothetical protein